MFNGRKEEKCRNSSKFRSETDDKLNKDQRVTGFVVILLLTTINVF